MTQSLTSDTFKTATQISEIYSCAPETLRSTHMTRYQELVSRFETVYGKKPSMIARAPGRISIMGEHLDCSDYGVLPMALEQDCLIAFSTSEEKELDINHMMQTVYHPRKLTVDPYQQINSEDKSYINYFLAGYKAALAETGLAEFVGLKILISGNLPQQAGLSSSSAFVVCSGVMALSANGIYETTPRKAFIENCIKYERSIGTACGGMDQTISVLGIKGSALAIEFNPIEATKVSLPEGYCFVVANSLSPSPKLLTLGKNFNKRVVECRLAVSLLLKELGFVHKTEIKSLKQLQVFLGRSLEEMLALLDQHVKKEAFTLKDLDNVFGGNLTRLIADIPYSDVVMSCNDEFFLHQRAFHIFTQVQRGHKFIDVCNEDIKDEDKAKKLGTLMTESYNSTRDFYDCSSRELEVLTQMASRLGAYGSKITGAGWGGCCISLVKESESEKFIQEIIKQYYLNKDYNLTVGDDLNMYIFSSFPASGAVALDPKSEPWF